MNKACFLVIMCCALCTIASRKKFIPEVDMQLDAAQLNQPTWKVMGFCDSSSVICIYIDTAAGYIIQIRQEGKSTFVVRDIDFPGAVDIITEGAYLTAKYRAKRLKLISKTFFTHTYEAKRGKMIIDVNADNSRITKITVTE